MLTDCAAADLVTKPGKRSTGSSRRSAPCSGESASAAPEPPGPQKPDHRIGRVPAVRDERVGPGQHEHGHVADPGLLDAHDPVVGARNRGRADGLGAAVAGDDPDFVVGVGQVGGQVGRVGPERAPHRTQHLRCELHLVQPVHEQAPPVGGSQQHHSAQRVGPVFDQVSADDEGAQGVSHEMHPGCHRAALLYDRAHRVEVFREGCREGGVFRNGHTVPGPPEPLAEDQHRGRRAPQTVDQHDRLLFRRSPVPAPRDGEPKRQDQQPFLLHDTRSYPGRDSRIAVVRFLSSCGRPPHFPDCKVRQARTSPLKV